MGNIYHFQVGYRSGGLNRDGREALRDREEAADVLEHERGLCGGRNTGGGNKDAVAVNCMGENNLGLEVIREGLIEAKNNLWGK